MRASPPAPIAREGAIRASDTVLPYLLVPVGIASRIAPSRAIAAGGDGRSPAPTKGFHHHGSGRSSQLSWSWRSPHDRVTVRWSPAWSLPLPRSRRSPRSSSNPILSCRSSLPELAPAVEQIQTLASQRSSPVTHRSRASSKPMACISSIQGRARRIPRSQGNRRQPLHRGRRCRPHAPRRHDARRGGRRSTSPSASRPTSKTATLPARAVGFDRLVVGEIFEIPCVAFDVETPDDAHDLAASGADLSRCASLPDCSSRTSRLTSHPSSRNWPIRHPRPDAVAHEQSRSRNEQSSARLSRGCRCWRRRRRPRRDRATARCRTLHP